jgi:hypothetical protein
MDTEVTQEPRVAKKEKPSLAHDLVSRGVQGMIGLALVAGAAPPRMQEPLAHIARDMAHLAMFAKAVEEISPECQAKVEERMREMKREAHERHEEQRGLAMGAVLGEMFRTDPNRRPVGHDDPDHPSRYLN